MVSSDVIHTALNTICWVNISAGDVKYFSYFFLENRV